jgi:DNA helicase-2/ATP-dependent DNA helicase PcrA
MLDLSRLTAEQRRVAVAPDGPLLVVAGPGSGKTTALAARAAYLVSRARSGRRACWR